MLRLLNFSFNGDIHSVFLITNIKVGNRIHRFCFPMPFRFRKHKGHDLAYDVNIMTSQQRLSRIQHLNVTSCEDDKSK
jgi:hypothetical protein